ncbi:MAG: acyltransferase [Actinobacteria bacterium]|nr:acyltransferase [Actinomycetota bacterium]
MHTTGQSAVGRTTSPSRRQDPSIQALRGVAVILMVAGHVIGTRGHGLRVGDSSVWHYVYLSLVDIRMPLFTLISGYVYAMIPISRWRDYPQLIKGKSRRLLFPLLTVGTVLYVVKRVVPGLNTDVHDIALWRVYVFQFEYLWFLQSLFLIFLVVGILDSLGILATRAGWATVMAVSTVAFVIIDVPGDVDVFTVSRALRLLPFFLLGYGMRRHRMFDLSGAAAVVTVSAFAGVYAVRMLTIFDVYHPNELADKAIAVGVGATALVLIYSSRHVLNARPLAWIGGFSFGIYLLHVFATASTQRVLEHLGLHGDVELFALCLLAGIAAPIAFELLFRNVWLVRTFVLGERRPRKAKPARPSGCTDNGNSNGAISGAADNPAPGRGAGRSVVTPKD